AVAFKEDCLATGFGSHLCLGLLREALDAAGGYAGLTEETATSALRSLSSVIIVGGGIIGSSTAYYLAKRGVREAYCWRASEFARRASGKGWRVSGSGLVRRRSRRAPCPAGLGELPLALELESELASHWIIDAWTLLSLRLRVHPYKLTTGLVARAAALAGSQVRRARVIGAQVAEGRIVSLTLDDVADAAVSTATTASSSTDKTDTAASTTTIDCRSAKNRIRHGPVDFHSSGRLAKSCRRLRRRVRHRAHSVVLSAPAGQLSPHALYTEQEGGESPELYPRPDGTIYICGLADDAPLPASTADVVADSNKLRRLAKFAESVSDRLSADSVVAGQACYLPVSRTGLPMIGQLHGLANGFVGAGHSCWGILNGPATGLMLADLLLDGACSFMDAEPFRPRLALPMAPRTGLGMESDGILAFSE
uniref:DAO domain-containing protein n=1 Tax=Macrostomum lignano TaxID=282301 RepID=A0A1I8FIW7_9PLAT